MPSRNVIGPGPRHAADLRRNRVLALLVSATFLSRICSAQLLEAHVAQGTLTGQTTGSVSAFLGIPFAAAPLGPNRWRPPQPAAAWKGVRTATRFAASCQQALTPTGFGPWTAEYVVQDTVSEDCLYLNVWTPARASQERLPVLVWIYGGGFSSGSGSVPIYDGAALAAQGIVVVSVNYRVGVYGFLAHPALSAESRAHASGNYGLMDQAAGLRWVHVNISAFGGDASRVTIAGQSAGAASVHHLIASPLATGLFARAIAQSGSGMGLQVPTRAAAEAQGLALSHAGGTSLSLPQLRALSPAQLDARVATLQAPGQPRGPGFGPVVDGEFLPNARSVGADTNDTPILTGMTANEMTGLNPAYGHVTIATFQSQVAAGYGSFAPDVIALYEPKSDADAWQATGALSRDRGLAALNAWAKDRLPHTHYPIYAYLWNHAEPGPDATRYGAFHSSEIPYIFQTLDTSKRPFTPLDRNLSRLISRYWINFVKSGDPNGPDLPPWPRLTEPDPHLLQIGDPTAARALLPAKQLTLFENYQAGGGKLGLF